MPTLLSRTAAAVVGVCAALAVGCSGGKTYPVSGKVTVNGTGVGGAVVVFHPAGDPKTMNRKPTALTKDDGSFVVGTLAGDDGAAPGEYLVTVVLPGQPKKAADPAKGVSLAGGEDRGSGGTPDQLRGRYGDPATSGLTATVKAEKNELPTLELKN